jgi:hypothetical protein
LKRLNAFTPSRFLILSAAKDLLLSSHPSAPSESPGIYRGFLVPPTKIKEERFLHASPPAKTDSVNLGDSSAPFDADLKLPLNKADTVYLKILTE